MTNNAFTIVGSRQTLTAASRAQLLVSGRELLACPTNPRKLQETGDQHHLANSKV